MVQSCEIGERLSVQAPCPICAEREVEVLALAGRGGQRLTTVICTGCGLVHSHPLPEREELQRYYARQYRSEYKGAFTPKRKHILRYSRGGVGRLEQLLHFVGPGTRLLDVGSGSGEFIYLARLAGFEVQGLEPHRGYSAYTRETFGARIVNAPMESADIAEGSLQAITLNHVLEHLLRPVDALATLNRWLEPGGLLAVEVPDIEHTQHSPVNRYHYAHIYNYNHDTLAAVLRKAGFEPESHPAASGTSLVARKCAAPDPGRPLPMPGNYRRLARVLSGEAAAKAYRRKRPLKRLLGKCRRYPLEILQAAVLRDPRRIVEREYHKWRAPGAALTP